MEDGTAAYDDPATARDSTSPPTAAPFGRMVITGAIVSLALGWTLLSWALALPFMLGVFFFMLFGLFVGAAMFRAAAGFIPVNRRTIVTATIIVVLIGWLTSLAKEGVDYPRDFVKHALKRVHVPDVEGGVEQVRSELDAFITKRLGENHPPGGVLGYFQLAATGQSVTIDDLPTRQPRPIVIPPRVSAAVWWIRNVLAAVMFYIAIFAVTVDLTRAPPAIQPTSEESDDHDQD